MAEPERREAMGAAAVAMAEADAPPVPRTVNYNGLAMGR
jgi:hypothetical protein